MKAKKSSLPSEAEILDFIASSPGTAGKRDIGRAFNIKGAAKIQLKSLLKDMERRGVLDRRRKKISVPGQLAPVTSIDVVGFDKDGELYGIPTEWKTEDGAPPHVLMQTQESRHEDTRPPKAGDRVLARITPLPNDEHYRYAARPMKNLTSRATRVLGVYRVFKGEGRIVSIDKKAKNDLQVTRGDDNNARDGELVSADIVRDRGRGLPAARVRERLGDVTDPRNISLLAIHQHGIPIIFPKMSLPNPKRSRCSHRQDVTISAACR